MKKLTQLIEQFNQIGTTQLSVRKVGNKFHIYQSKPNETERRIAMLPLQTAIKLIQNRIEAGR